jgi:hypothetical protein
MKYFILQSYREGNRLPAVSRQRVRERLGGSDPVNSPEPWPAVKIGIEAQNRSNPVLLHYRDMNASGAGIEERFLTIPAARSLARVRAPVRYLGTFESMGIRLDNPVRSGPASA